MFNKHHAKIQPFACKQYTQQEGPNISRSSGLDLWNKVYHRLLEQQILRHIQLALKNFFYILGYANLFQLDSLSSPFPVAPQY